MGDSLFKFVSIHATTWVYLSSLLVIALYFKFSRVWSIRNLDLIVLLLFAPGMLLVHFGREHNSGTIEVIGFFSLLSVTGLLLARMLLDHMLVRRPLLEPNLSPGGLTFMGFALCCFLAFNVVTSTPEADDLAGPRGADRLLSGEGDKAYDELTKHGPGYPLLHVLPNVATLSFLPTRASGEQAGYATVAKIVAILSQLAVVAGVVFIGYRHFENLKMGIGAATLYLLLPCTAELAGRVPHVLPAALLVWSVALYRRPLFSGILLGLAMGASYYPMFLLPLWISFYWRRGMWRLLLGVGSMLALTVLSLVFVSDGLDGFWLNVRKVFGLWFARMDGLEGVWGLAWYPVYRIPIMAAFCALSFSYALWPARKNLGTLLSGAAVIMLAAQFWHGFGGGLYMAWYLPLALLVVFRPNLEDRVALSVLGEGWFPKRRALELRAVDKAA